MERRRTSMPCARMSLLAVLMLSLSAAQIAAALRCYCSDCGNGQSECTGDHCFAQIVNSGGTSLRRWRCYNSVNSYLCNTTSYLHTTFCCDSVDLCNANLNPTLSPPTSSSTSSGVATTQPATQSTLAPVINPLTETDSSDPEPTLSPLNSSTSQEGSPLLARSCYESDSENEEQVVRLCELHTDNWCFSTWRRRNNGVVHFRRGCANSCQPANRNRKVKLCCRSSLCNVDELPQNISYNSSQRGDGTEVSTTLSPTTLPPSTPSLTTPPPSTPTLPPSSSPSSPSISLRPIIEPETDPPAVTQTQAPTTVGFYCYCSHCTGRFCWTTTGCVLQRGRSVTTQSCLSESNQDVCVMNSTATTTIECCTSGLCNRNPEGENTFLPPTTSPQTTTDQSGPSIHLPSLVPETTMQATTASTTGDTAELTNERTTGPTIEPTNGPLQDTVSPTPHPSTSSQPSTEPQPQSLSIYYILIIVLSALTVLIIASIAGVCVYLYVECKRKRLNMCNHNKETDSSSSTTPV